MNQLKKTQRVLIMNEEQMHQFNSFLQEYPGKFCIPVMVEMGKYIVEQEEKQNDKDANRG